MPFVLGPQRVIFHKDIPLARVVRECVAYQSHRFELHPQLSAELENFEWG